MARSHIPEALVKLAQVLEDSPDLRAWFTGLRSVSFANRVNAFSSMGRRMRDEGQDEDTIKAVYSLAQPDIYRAILEIVDPEEE